MPTDTLADGLSITHPYFSYYATQLSLPKMSTEMFWWLKGHYDLSQNPDDSYLRSSIYHNTTDSAIRAAYSALRIYKPALCDITLVLTPYGKSVADKTHDIVIQSRDIPMEYHQTMESDLNFISCFLPWRIVGLLAIMNLAIDNAKVKHLELLAKTNNLPPNPRAVSIAKKKDLHPLGSPLPFFNDSYDVYTEKDITVHTVKFGKDDLIAYIPAVIFGTGRARSDYRELARYGLLDIHSVRDGSRGRAKLGLTTSSVGKQLIKDLARKGLIQGQAVL
jgi:hypothetical protein